MQTRPSDKTQLVDQGRGNLCKLHQFTCDQASAFAAPAAAVRTLPTAIQARRMHLPPHPPRSAYFGRPLPLRCITRLLQTPLDGALPSLLPRRRTPPKNNLCRRDGRRRRRRRLRRHLKKRPLPSFNVCEAARAPPSGPPSVWFLIEKVPT